MAKPSTAIMPRTAVVCAPAYGTSVTAVSTRPASEIQAITPCRAFGTKASSSRTRSATPVSTNSGVNAAKSLGE